MERQEDETVPSFNGIFAGFYYKMTKEIKPLENAAKLYYASNLLPKLSMLLLEIKLATLQKMFIDSLKVEDNLRMSKNLSDQDSGDKIDKELELEEQHEKETFFSTFQSFLL